MLDAGYRRLVNSENEEYYENFSQDISDFTYDVRNLETGVDMVNDYVRRRLIAISKRVPGPLILMMSGGIDSIHAAAVAANSQLEACTFTFHVPGSQVSEEETENAKRVAELLGLRHVIVSPTVEDFSSLLRRVMVRLDTAEPWEVVAGLVLRSIVEESCSQEYQGAIVSAAGADGLFLGGQDFLSSEEESVTLAQWEAEVRENLRRNFRWGRFIPDFYERIIDGPNRHFKVWQTAAAVELAGSIHPTLLRGKDWSQDKMLLRSAAQALGVSKDLVARKKDPMQVSSGGFAAIERLARESLAVDFSGKTYSDPLGDTSEVIISRLYLRDLFNKLN